MKLLHVFIQRSMNIKFMLGIDRCIYCNKEAFDIYKELKQPEQAAIDDNNGGEIDFLEYEKIFNKFTNCPNGITEEEYIIKNIIE